MFHHAANPEFRKISKRVRKERKILWVLILVHNIRCGDTVTDLVVTLI